MQEINTPDYCFFFKYHAYSKYNIIAIYQPDKYRKNQDLLITNKLNIYLN